MNSFILVIALSVYRPLPASFMISEFSSKESCEVALVQAKKFWKTIDDESRCISVKDYLRKEKLKKELQKEQE